jgi:serine/threonine protein phosphatase PrpC
MGCVAIICLITRDFIYAANLGDSRATLAEKMSENRIEIVEMSQDHKPSNKIEEERIKAGGKWVVLNRIEGRISIARAIGDWEYKDP